MKTYLLLFVSVKFCASKYAFYTTREYVSILIFRLSLYNCLSTGQTEGVIECIMEAETIASIQVGHTKSSIMSPFNKQSLLAYIERNNTTPEE